MSSKCCNCKSLYETLDLEYTLTFVANGNPTLNPSSPPNRTQSDGKPVVWFYEIDNYATAYDTKYKNVVVQKKYFDFKWTNLIGLGLRSASKCDCIVGSPGTLLKRTKVGESTIKGGSPIRRKFTGRWRGTEGNSVPLTAANKYSRVIETKRFLSSYSVSHQCGKTCPSNPKIDGTFDNESIVRNIMLYIVTIIQ